MIGFNIIYKFKDPVKFPDNQQISFLDKDNYCYHFDYNRKPKFENDKLFDETKNYIFGIDGPILNLDHLKKKHNNSDWTTLFLSLYEKHNKQLPSLLVGEFCGFVFNKNNHQLFVFTNQTGGRKFYYHKSNQGTIISNSLESLSAIGQQFNINFELDVKSAYALLTYGGMIDNQTLMTDVKRLHAGESLLINENQTIVNKYIDFNETQYTEKTENQFIDQLNEIFESSLIEALEKDRAYNYNHLATLSGGLDSRMVYMIGHKKGYELKPFCFSQKGYDDELIANQISEDTNQKLLFIPLDEAKHLFDYNENLNLNDCLSFYLGSAHFNYGLKQLDLESYGMIHTGMIGDAILGGGNTAPKQQNPNLKAKLISAKLFDKIESTVKEASRNYVNEEVFYLVNRLLNVTISGLYVCNNHLYHATPFMHHEFIQLALSIPPKYKYKQKLYLKWIQRHHADIAKYKWEKTGFSPTAIWKTEMARYTKKVKSIYHKSIGANNLSSMTPYDYWYKTKPAIKVFFEETFNSKKHLIQNNHELYADVEKLFTEGNIPEKSLALTLLGAVDKYNLAI